MHSWILCRVLILGLCLPPFAATAELPPPAEITIDYTQHVRPVLAEKCFSCHGQQQAQSGLRLDLRQNALRGGDYGIVIVPGKSAESKLILRVAGSTVGLQMPPSGPLTPEEIGILRAWIDQGAEMPGRAEERLVEKKPLDPKLESFLAAIHRHDLATVGAALRAEPWLASAADAAGSTSLMHAAYAGTIEIVQLLLKAGADVNAQNERQATALHWAALDPGKMRLLIDSGADLNAGTVEGRTPLYLAAMQPDGRGAVKLLLDAGADPNKATLTGTTPLFVAVGANLESAKLLLAKGAEVNAKTGTGGTPLMAAATANDKAVALLVEHGADVAARTKRGETALANAAHKGLLASVRLLLEKGADVNATDYRGYSVLMHAAYNDRVSREMIALLLSKGADVNVTGEGETAFSLAAKRGETEVTGLLRPNRKRAGVP